MLQLGRSLADPHEQDVREILVAVQTQGAQADQALPHGRRVPLVCQKITGHEGLATVDERQAAQPPRLPQDGDQILLADLAVAELQDEQVGAEAPVAGAPERQARQDGEAGEAEALEMIVGDGEGGENVGEGLLLAGAQVDYVLFVEVARLHRLKIELFMTSGLKILE